jgi:ribonuclease P protein component
VSANAPNGSSNVSGGRARFPRSARLLRHADFERVYKHGRRHFAAHMTVFYLARSEGEGLRVGFTVGRVLGGAVLRNRMKRRLREAVRLQRPAESAAVDVVINPKKALLTADFAELQNEVSRAFEVIRKSVEKRAT